MFALLAAVPKTLSITPTMQKQWPQTYPNMIQSYKDAQAEVRAPLWLPSFQLMTNAFGQTHRGKRPVPGLPVHAKPHPDPSAYVLDL